MDAADGPQHILRETPSLTPGISDAVVIKDLNLFFLSRQDASLPVEGEHGLGLYYHDCRFLEGYEMRIGGYRPETLVSTGAKGYQALYELTNPELASHDGQRLLRKREVGIKWLRVLDGDNLSLHDHIAFRSFSLCQTHLPLTLVFRAGFQDIFAVRSLIHDLPGRVHAPRWENDVLVFRYEGYDGLYRMVTIQFWPPPDRRERILAHYDLELPPGEERVLQVSVKVGEAEGRFPPVRRAARQPELQKLERVHRTLTNRWLRGQASVLSSSLRLDSVIERSLRDLRLLRTTLGTHHFYAAGIPWFATLFGRDSIITALQTLAFDPHIAEETLRVLAALQGKVVDRWRDEEPGKILHELRVGELARARAVPHSPYFGAVDATPLFLILLARHAHWRGNLELFEELQESVAAALDWIDRYGTSQSGYLSYESASAFGLVNQGWRDSWDGVLNADGSAALPPIALVEVQAYVYEAKLSLATLYRRAGQEERALRLEAQAADLKTRFNRDFWLADKGHYALALQKEGAPAAVLASNVGHALWSGIADADKARLTVERLMAPDMFCGWGVRTLSEKEVGYNPLGYHLGTVWPHDNSLIAAGFKRYGLDEEAALLFAGMITAAMRFEDFRLPELFAGYSKDDYEVPVRYPLANRPQAWAAGAMPYMLETLLGLQPEAFDGRLRIVRPALPERVERVDLRGLRVGEARVDLRFNRSQEGVAVQVLGRTAPLDVLVEL